MVSRRTSRQLAIAFVVTVVLFYLGWRRSLTWDGLSKIPTSVWDQNGAASAEEQTPPTVPPSQADQHANHPHGNTMPKPPEFPGKDNSDYDFERPKSPEEAGYPDPVRPAADSQEQLKPDCPPSYENYLRGRPGPPSAGSRQFPFVRPPPACRTYKVPALEDYIGKMEATIKDPDLYRLFQNSFPNTLDTMVKWHGYANDEEGKPTGEELTYIITGDIDAMWLRDSASQLYSYLSFLSPHNAEGNDNIDSLNSLWRGLINSHARYILISPYCHAFQPPPESGVSPTHNGAYSQNNPQPGYDPKKVFDCKWELDSLASFLQVSVGYWEHTHDLSFFARHNWIEAVQTAVDAAGAMRLGTYDEEGRVLKSAWTFTGWTNRGSETLTNDGLGNPVKTNGMVRTAFRPSDDATIFQLLVPANMMFAKYLEEASVMMEELAEGAVHPIDPAKQETARKLTQVMRDFAFGIRKGIDEDAIVTHRDFGEIFAYECDGFGGVNLMDDANIPSLLSMPLFDYATSRYPLPAGAKKRDYNQIYQNTRRFVLSLANPYFAQGPAISAVGGPHLGPGKAWPMAALVAAMTAMEEESGLVDDRGRSEAAGAAELEDVVAEQLRMVLDSTSGYGVVHESVNSWNGKAFTRSWFGWANGLLGELVIRIEKWEKINKMSEGQGLLGRSWQ